MQNVGSDSNARLVSAGRSLWFRTRVLAGVALAVWFFFAFQIPWFAHELNAFSFLGFPMGYYMAAQGSPLAFVILLHWAARRQERLDRAYAAALAAPSSSPAR